MKRKSVQLAALSLVAFASIVCSAETRNQADTVATKHSVRVEHESDNPCGCLHGVGGQTFQVFFEVKADKHTTIRFVSADSSDSFTVFDNILDRNCTLSVTDQKLFWEHDLTTDSCLSIPLPTLEAGRYYIEYQSPDTLWTKSLVIMK